jgi:hypothetical protein
MVSPEHGAGVFSVWQTITGGTDPLELKRRTWDSGDPYGELDSLDLSIVENDREYPFIAIRARTGDLDAFCKDNATDLGRVFTGNYEDEELRYLDQYVNAENNVSRGRYERLYVRWTDALAVYSDSVDESEYEKTLFRAVQLFENALFFGDSWTMRTVEWRRFLPRCLFTGRVPGQFRRSSSRSGIFSASLLTRRRSGRWRPPASWLRRTSLSGLTTGSRRQIGAAI